MTNEFYADSLNRLIEELGKLPGIGPKSAERIAFHILNSKKEEAAAFAKAISDVKNNIKSCRQCGNFADGPLCKICSDDRRDKSIICVVEQPKDIISLEKTNLCKWVYHVLGGHIAPLDGVDPDALNIDRLVERVKSGTVKELVMATNPNIEGDGTVLYICSLLKNLPVKVTRLARGLPTGSTIEFANAKMLADAIAGRQQID